MTHDYALDLDLSAAAAPDPVTDEIPRDGAPCPRGAVLPLPGHGKGCPKCEEGVMLTKEITGRSGETYVLLSCNNYPDCKHGERP